MSYTIRVECCVCGKYVRDKDGGTEPNLISHTYCSECLLKVKAEIAEYCKTTK